MALESPELPDSNMINAESAQFCFWYRNCLVNAIGDRSPVHCIVLMDKSTGSEKGMQRNQIKVKVIHNAVSEMTSTRMVEFPPKIYQTFVSIRNDRQIMGHKNPNSHLAQSLLDKVKTLETDVFALLDRRRERERAQYKQLEEVTFREIQLFEKTKNAEIDLLKAKLAKQKLAIIRQKKLIKKLALERDSHKKDLDLITKRRKSKKKTENELASISPESENQLISQRNVDLTSEVESGGSENEFPTSENERRICEKGEDDILGEENEIASTVDSEERCERVREMGEDEDEEEVEVVTEQTREIEILSEERNTGGKRETENLLRRKGAGSRSSSNSSSSSSSVGELRLKHQVVVFVGKWLKKNVGSFDHSEANMLVVQGKSRQFCSEIGFRRDLSSNTPRIQLSSDEKAAITKDLEKSYSSKNLKP